tara:strand:+ start:4905 stop:5807 length:903 start_codon:yes stop_codon:yes gene_type:complete
MTQVSNLPTLTEQSPPPPWADAHSLISEYNDASIDRRIEIIEQCVEWWAPTSVQWGQNWEYCRACNYLGLELPTNVSDLIWPPEQLARQGRANAAGNSIMYVSDREGTALSEVEHKSGLAVVSRYRIRNPGGIRLIPLGEITAIQRSGHGPFLQDQSHVISGMLRACHREDALTLILIDSFLADLMAKHDINYLETVALVNAVYNKCPNAVGIGYPSVMCRGGMNIALKTDGFWDDWNLTMVTACEYESPGYAIHRPMTRQNVKGITNSGDLRWDGPETNLWLAAELNPPFIPNPKFPLR